MALREDMKNINALIKHMDEQLKFLDEMTDNTITDGYGFDIKIKEKIPALGEGESLSESDVIKILLTNDEISGKEAGTTQANLTNMKSSNEEYADKEDIEYFKYVVEYIGKCIKESNDLKAQKESVLKEVDTMSENYFNYVNSSEYKEKRMKRIEDMRSQIESEPDLYKRGKIVKRLNAMESANKLQFLFDRIDQYGDKEVEGIIKVFFDSKRSELVMEKFASRLPKYGYNKDIYKMFFNIEEKFLPEEYHDLNNIFLFHVMRFISFTDTYDECDSLYVSTILLKLYNLLYHRYEDQSMENEFVDIIKKFDDYMMPHIERFTKYNTTSPKHPTRIKRDEEYEQKRRMMIIASLQNEGIEPDTSLSTEELRAMLQEVIDKKEAEKQSMVVTKTSEEVLEEVSNENETENETVENIIDDSTDNPEFKSHDELSNYVDTIESSAELDELDKMMDEINTDELVNPEDLEKKQQEAGEVIKDVETYINPESTEIDNDVEIVTLDELETLLENVETSDEIEDMETLQDNIAEELTTSLELDDTPLNDTVVDDTPEEESMIVQRRGTVPKKEEVEIEVYVDQYKCYYTKINDSYVYCEENGTVIEQNISEETVLQLVSTGSVDKTKITVLV